MLRLTFLLCSALFLTMLIGGRDYGQMRAGLAAAAGQTASEEKPILIRPVEVASLDIVAATTNAAAQASDVPIVIEPAAAPVIQPAAAPLPAASPEVAAASDGSELLLYVTAEMVNVRSGPSTTYPVIGKLAEGEAALLVGTDEGGWAPIRIEGDGIEGFVSSRYLSSIAPY